MSSWFQGFFTQLERWEEKKVVMNTAGDFLIELVTPEVARELKEQLLFVNRRWEEVGEEAKRFLAREGAERGRREYGDVVGRLEAWLEAAETLAGPRNLLPCSHADVKTNVQQLDVSARKS